MGLKKYIRVIVFISIGILIFFRAQKVLSPVFDAASLSETYQINDFYSLKEDELDVIFLGTSHVLFGISPSELYDEKQIVSYSLASASQPLEMSYYWMEECFKTQSPKVVCWDVGRLFGASDVDEKWRRCLDDMKLGESKMHAAAEYAKLGEGIKEQQERFHSIMLPLIQYHTRWKGAITAKPLEEYHVQYILRGYAITTNNGQLALTTEHMNSLADYDEISQCYSKSYDFENEVEEKKEDVVYTTKIRDDACFWLDKMQQLCKAHGAELLLIKVPTQADPIAYSGAWYQDKSVIVKEIAGEMNIPFFDLLYDTDVNIDEKMDYYDNGGHMNCRGAEKVSDCIADYLCENYDLELNVSEDMEKDKVLYERLKEIAMLQTENDFAEYCKLLKDDEFVVLMSVKGDMIPFLTEGNVKALESLGMKTNFLNDFEPRNAYVALVDGGIINYEAVSNRQLNVARKVSDKLSVRIESPGNVASSASAIHINGKRLAKNIEGLHVIVLDKKTNVVIENVVFDAEGNKQEGAYEEEWIARMNYVKTAQSNE